MSHLKVRLQIRFFGVAFVAVGTFKVSRFFVNLSYVSSLFELCLQSFVTKVTLMLPHFVVNIFDVVPLPLVADENLVALGAWNAGNLNMDIFDVSSQVGQSAKRFTALVTIIRF